MFPENHRSTIQILVFVFKICSVKKICFGQQSEIVSVIISFPYSILYQRRIFVSCSINCFCCTFTLNSIRHCLLNLDIRNQQNKQNKTILWLQSHKPAAPQNKKLKNLKTKLILVLNLLRKIGKS
jgi:hypothetical protein